MAHAVVYKRVMWRCIWQKGGWCINEARTRVFKEAEVTCLNLCWPCLSTHGLASYFPVILALLSRGGSKIGSTSSSRQQPDQQQNEMIVFFCYFIILSLFAGSLNWDRDLSQISLTSYRFRFRKPYLYKQGLKNREIQALNSLVYITHSLS